MVFHFSEELPVFNKAVVTIGSFDGVHHGHKTILRTVAASARSIGGESILVTFDPHPRKVINPEVSLGLLCTPDEKYKLVLNEGIDHIVVVPFSRDFSMMSAEDYIHNFLYKNFKPHKIVIGYDHKFGHSREGDIHLLKRALPQVQIEEIAPQLLEDAAISSSKIRKALHKGDIVHAGEMLERFYTLTGTVIHGKKLGHTIGFPTANIQVSNPDVLVPAEGVYAVVVAVDKNAYGGMLNIGYNPTVSNEGLWSCEVNIFDFNENIYGKSITLYFISRLRNEEKFAGINALIHQLNADKANALQQLAHIDFTSFLAKNNIFL